jgi:hypothetical protein
MYNRIRKKVRIIAGFLPETVKNQYRKLKNPLNQYKRRLSSYFDDTELYLISYPCSGRTWLRVLIGKLLCDHFSLDEKLMLDTPNLTQKAGILKSMYTHDCSLVEDYYYYVANEVFFDKARFSGKKVILLVRDPRDVMVSYYSHLSKRDKKYKGSISEFIRDEKVGIKKLLAFNNLWIDNQHFLKELLIIKYEDIRRETAINLKKVISFMEVEDFSQNVLDKSIEFASFENMKKLEKINFWKDYSRANILQPRTSNPEGSKVRQGKVGDFANTLSEEDIKFINDSIVEFNCLLYQSVD